MPDDIKTIPGASIKYVCSACYFSTDNISDMEKHNPPDSFILMIPA